MKLLRVVLVVCFVSLAALLAGCQTIVQIISPATMTLTVTATFTPTQTFTPLPTFTRTPKPTATATTAPTSTPVPTKIPTQKPVLPVAPSATSEEGGSTGGTTPVTWQNETSHIIKVVANGPANYSVTLQPHSEQMVNWVAGDYTIYYYLDGGSSVAGQETYTVSPEQHNLLVLNFR